jgi:hypothetical protein
MRYSRLCGPTVTASGSIAESPCRVRRCWKSTPLETDTHVSSARMQR